MADVIIDFKVNYDQLDSAIGVLEKTGQVDAKVAQSFKATNQAIAQQGATLQKTAQSFKGPITSIDQLDKRSRVFVENFVKIVGKGLGDAVAIAKVEIDAMKAKIIELEGKTKGAGTATNSLKKELKELTIQIQAAKASGSPIDPSIIQRAGELKDAIADANAEIKNAGSDTRGLDNLIGTAQAVAGGFAIMQGAAALFGDESEEMQKTLLKVNAAMSVLQGLQSIQNALQKEGAITQAFANAQRTISTVQTNLQAAAESRLTVVRYAAIAAQKILNFVLSINPFVAIATALIAVIGYLAVYTRNTREAAEATGELRGAAKLLTDTLEERAEVISRNSQREILDLKKAGAEESRIIQARIDAIRNQIEANEFAARKAREILDKGLGEAEDRQKAQDALTAIYKKNALLRIQANELEFDKEKQLAAERKALMDKRIADEAKALEASRQRLSDQIDLLKAERLQLDENTKAYAEITLTINRLQTALDNMSQTIARQTLNWAENKAAAKDAITDIQNSVTGGFQNALDKMKDEIGKVGTKATEVGGVITAQLGGALEGVADTFDKQVAIIQKDVTTVTAALGQLYNIIGQLSQERQQNQQIEIENRKKDVDALLEAGAITEKEAAARQKRIDRESAAQRTKAAQQAKQLAIFQAIISTAQAVVNALATPPAPVGIALAAVVGALGAAQISAIAARPIPKFATGKKGTWSGVGQWGEAGTEMKVNKHGQIEFASKPTISYIGPQDRIYTASETKRILPFVDKGAMTPAKAQGNDLNRLIAALPKQQPGTSINIDKDFIKEAVRDGLNTTNYFNRRYRR